MQQRDYGAGWTHDPAIRVVVKTKTYFVSIVTEDLVFGKIYLESS